MNLIIKLIAWVINFPHGISAKSIDTSKNKYNAKEVEDMYNNIEVGGVRMQNK